ncbi:hypothetical protein D3C75_1318090 [compost metagenome]
MCLHRHGLSDADGLSDAQIESLGASVDYAPSTPDAIPCVVDPFGGSGLSADEIVELWRDGRAQDAPREP